MPSWLWFDLHLLSKLDSPENAKQSFFRLRSPVDIFFSSKSVHSGMARMLLCLSIPAHLLFLIVIKITRDIFVITSSFLIVYVIAASFQVACLLVLAYTLTHFLWKKGTLTASCNYPCKYLSDKFFTRVLLISLLFSSSNHRKLFDQKGINPDNSTIPFLTASGDLIGSALLALAFVILSELQDENAIQVTNLIKSNSTGVVN